MSMRNSRTTSRSHEPKYCATFTGTVNRDSCSWHEKNKMSTSQSTFQQLNLHITIYMYTAI